MRDGLNRLVILRHFVHNICNAVRGCHDPPPLFLEGDCVRPGPEFTELIEPNRIAFVLSFVMSKFVFGLRGGNFHATQSADRIVFAIRI